jgi:hypothetical protein
MALVAAAGCAQGQFGPDARVFVPSPDAAYQPDDGIFVRPDARVDAMGAQSPDAAIPDAFQADGPCFDTGAVCSTGNPGNCGVGHQHCVGGVSACTPDVTTQTCYDGTPGTAGHGVCQAGTQSCIGTLGACNGEVVDAPIENCFNDSDDNCNDAINDGCPDHLILGSTYALTAEGGSGGGAASAMCPAGQIVARATMYFDDISTEHHGDGIAVYCVTPTLTRGTSSYTLGTTALPGSATASFMGTHGQNPDFDQDCTVGGGLGAVFGTYTDSNTYVDGIGVACATGSATLDSFNDLSISLGYDGRWAAGDWITPNVGIWQYCDADSAVVGYQGRDGLWLDQIQPVCAPIYVVYK